MGSLGRWFILLGVVFIVLGVLLSYSGFSAFLKLGRLPGDISIKRENFSLYFPLTTSILLSLAISLILYLLRK
jgi:hypothetical protein